MHQIAEQPSITCLELAKLRHPYDVSPMVCIKPTLSLWVFEKMDMGDMNLRAVAGPPQMVSFPPNP